MIATSRTLPMPEHWSIFERSRRRLVIVASRILGSSDYAEDIVQETALRWLKTDLATVRAPEGWLVAVVSRLAIDRLRRAFTERHAHLEYSREAHDAEPSVAQPDDGPEIGSELTKAFVLLRERLEPSERTAFALRELFDCSYAEIAHVLAKSEAACRQIVHRAHERLRRSGSPRSSRREELPQLSRRFLEALRAEDREDALSILMQPAADEAPRPARRQDACLGRGGAAAPSAAYAAPGRGRQRRRVREHVARVARAREMVVGAAEHAPAPELALVRENLAAREPVPHREPRA